MESVYQNVKNMEAYSERNALETDFGTGLLTGTQEVNYDSENVPGDIILCCSCCCGSGGATQAEKQK